MFKGFSLWAGVISGGLAQLKDTQSVTTGHMDKKEYAIQTSQNLTGGLGIMAGIEYGAVLGSLVLPGPGTIIGSLIGSMIGNRVGNYAGYQAGNMIFNNKFVNNTPLLQNDKMNLYENKATHF